MEDALTRNVRVVHVHPKAGHHCDATIPVKARATGDHALIGGEHLPLLARLTHVEGPGVCHPHSSHDRLPVLQHRAKIALDWCRHTLQLTSVEDLGFARKPGGFESVAYFPRDGSPMEWPVDDCSRYDRDQPDDDEEHGLP